LCGAVTAGSAPNLGVVMPRPNVTRSDRCPSTLAPPTRHALSFLLAHCTGSDLSPARSGRPRRRLFPIERHSGVWCMGADALCVKDRHRLTRRIKIDRRILAAEPGRSRPRAKRQRPAHAPASRAASVRGSSRRPSHHRASVRRGGVRRESEARRAAEARVAPIDSDARSRPGSDPRPGGS